MPLWLWLAATAGNTAGSCVNWYLGLFIRRFQSKRWFPVDARQLQRASERYQRYGAWSLLFAWLPVIGDPLTVVAGVLKVRFALFFPLVLIGKGCRYALLIWFSSSFL